MQITESGILACGSANSARAALTFPSLVALADGTVIATCRAGSAKDAADEKIELYRSPDGGRTWSGPQCPFTAPQVNGVQGSLKVCYLTELEPGHLVAASMWVDRQTYPGKPLFNPETEGCLPMAILLADSLDLGATWTPWRLVPMPVDIGPPSLTSPMLKLADGRLAMSIETNKHYEDASRWHQRVVLIHSTDQGQTWSDPVVAGQDPSGRIFNWDQRAGVATDGRIATFCWTYDSHTHTYLNIHRRISADHGHTWSTAEDLGFTDQAAHPAMAPDGRVVLAWVDRFHTHSIRARLALGIDAPFDPATEVEIYSHTSETARKAARDDTGALLSDMSLWTFGLPYAELLTDGDVLVLYYAGTEACMDIHWSRLRLSA